ncbi:MAG: hypothetical protein JRI68_03360 [Deltaproteobacteria bacterium]|nr:hypothetical protein [Deltaproteobacteria bacterium]
MSFRLSPIVVMSVAVAAVLASCMLDFDAYDPRLGEGAAAGQGGGQTGGTGGTTSSSGTGGATGGNGGSTSGTGGGGGSTSGSGGGGGSTSGSGGGGGVGGSTSGSGGDGGTAPTNVEYLADVADCVYVTAPNPDTCEADAAADQMTVDLTVAQAGNAEARVFLRFNLDGELVGKQVLAVVLEMRVTNGANADGPGTGEVWEVAAFTRPDLFNSVPAPQGSAAIASDQGAVVANDWVHWTLPSSVVAPNSSVFLGVQTSFTNGVDYWNKDGLFPPKLIVTYQ